MATSVSEIQKIIDEALEGDEPYLKAVPDRETWGSTPEDIAAQQKMEALAQKERTKRKAKRPLG
jgi:hypothetical protein